jgi:hypothetical protein
LCSIDEKKLVGLVIEKLLISIVLTFISIIGWMFSKEELVIVATFNFFIQCDINDDKLW